MKRNATLLVLIAAVVGFTACREPATATGDRAETGAEARAGEVVEQAAAEGPEEPNAIVIDDQSPTHENRITMASTPSASQALDVIRKRVASQDEAEAPPPTATPVLARGLVSGPAGTLQSPDLGLMCTANAVGLFTHEDAVAHCQSLNLAGHGDWRLPNIGELDTLAVSPSFPANRRAVQALWSSSARDASGHFLLVMADRSIVHRSSGTAHTVCVRLIRN